MLICLTAGWPGTAGPCLPLEALSSSPVDAHICLDSSSMAGCFCSTSCAEIVLKLLSQGSVLDLFLILH